MVLRALLIWLTGLVTLVPYGTWYLFFEASRDQYALLITLILFWIFGYWGVAGPILAAIRVRLVLRGLEMAQQQGRLREALRDNETQEVVVDLIAADNQSSTLPRPRALSPGRPEGSRGSRRTFKLGRTAMSDAAARRLSIRAECRSNAP